MPVDDETTDNETIASQRRSGVRALTQRVFFSCAYLAGIKRLLIRGNLDGITRGVQAARDFASPCCAARQIGQRDLSQLYRRSRYGLAKSCEIPMARGGGKRLARRFRSKRNCPA